MNHKLLKLTYRNLKITFQLFLDEIILIILKFQKNLSNNNYIIICIVKMIKNINFIIKINSLIKLLLFEI
jgi:hypothetical protein